MDGQSEAETDFTNKGQGRERKTVRKKETNKQTIKQTKKRGG